MTFLEDESQGIMLSSTCQQPHVLFQPKAMSPLSILRRMILFLDFFPNTRAKCGPKVDFAKIIYPSTKCKASKRSLI